MILERGCSSFCLVTASIIILKQHDEKKVREESIYSTYTSMPSVMQEESQGRNLNAGADAKVMERS